MFLRSYLHRSFLLLFFFIPGLLSAEMPPEGEGSHFLSKEKQVIKGSDLSLLPVFEGREELLQSVILNKPELCLEMLYTMPLPDTRGDDIFMFLFNRLNHLSSMSGLEYYSANEGAMKLYLESCFLVEREGKKRPLPDLQYSVLPREASFVLFQKDTTFGSNWYEVTSRVNSQAIRLSMSNLNRMWYYVVPIMGPGGIKIDLILIPGRESLQFYALSQIKQSVSEVFGKKIYLPGVFDHRVSAIQGWFARQIYPEAVPGKLP